MPIPSDAIDAWRDRLTREWNARAERGQPPADETSASREYLLIALETYRPEPGEPTQPAVADLVKVTHGGVRDVTRMLGTLQRRGLLPGEPSP